MAIPRLLFLRVWCVFAGARISVDIRLIGRSNSLIGGKIPLIRQATNLSSKRLKYLVILAPLAAV
jgi:hypothetical protein